MFAEIKVSIMKQLYIITCLFVYLIFILFEINALDSNKIKMNLSPLKQSYSKLIGWAITFIILDRHL